MVQLLDLGSNDVIGRLHNPTALLLEKGLPVSTEYEIG